MVDLPLWFKILVVAPPLIIAVVLHEIAHGWTAEKFGDDTARKMGRITLNPISHVDPVMTILFPLVLILVGSPIIFGGAKPVPVNPYQLRNPKRDMVWVALAGPVTNVVLAIIGFVLFFLYANVYQFLPLPNIANNIIVMMCFNGILINLVLCLFNLIPVPPLDGGRIVVGLLPNHLAATYAQVERFGLLIVIAILYSGIFEKVLDPVFRITLKVIGKIAA